MKRSNARQDLESSASTRLSMRWKKEGCLAAGQDQHSTVTAPERRKCTVLTRRNHAWVRIPKEAQRQDLTRTSFATRYFFHLEPLIPSSCADSWYQHQSFPIVPQSACRDVHRSASPLCRSRRGACLGHVWSRESSRRSMPVAACRLCCCSEASTDCPRWVRNPDP